MNNYFNSLSSWFLRQNSLSLFILFCLAGLQLNVASSTGSINILAIIELIGILSVISWIYSVGIKSRQLLITNGADLKGVVIFNLIFGIAIIATILLHYLAKEQILLDKSFDTDGIVTTAISGSNVRAYSVALQKDGKILAAGSSSIGVTEVMILVRYNINGSLDTSFNHTGILTSTIGAVFTEVYAIAIQKDGKIVVTGGVSNDAVDFNIAVIRFNSDGTLDNTLDADGIVVTDLGSLYDFANSLVIQDNGKTLSEHELKLLGQRFWRKSAEQPGHGLGLSLVKTILSKYDYDIKFYGTYPQGLTVEISPFYSLAN